MIANIVVSEFLVWLQAGAFIFGMVAIPCVLVEMIERHEKKKN